MPYPVPPPAAPRQQGSLRLFPPIVEFHGIEESTLYVLEIVIQNVSDTVRTIRFLAPETDAFTLNYVPATAVAPGLSITAARVCLDASLRRSTDPTRPF